MSLPLKQCESPNFVRLQTSDGVVYTVELRLVLQMGTIRDMLKVECCPSSDTIPLANIESGTMELVIKWCELFNNAGEDQEKNDPSLIFREMLWDNEASDEDIFRLLMAANYLNLESLIDVATHYIASIINGCQSAKEIRIRFGIKNDFSINDYFED
ncbi:hypothetical protein KR009_008419 [Drosophila setifemur]|nr:hypothetical protein KR009_008419 [Drosophila setifemur]